MALAVLNEDGQSKDDSKKSYDIHTLRFFRKNVVIVSICALTLTTILLTVTIIILLLRHDQGSSSGSSPPVNKNISSVESLGKEQYSNIISNISSVKSSDPKANLTLPGKLKLISRPEWLADPPVEPANPLSVPVPYVIILSTGTENCSSQAQCVFHVRFIQTFHIESRNWWDIGYNFLVGGDGEAYEGRGWKSEGAHTYGYNAKSIGIAFIGTFNSFKPPERQILACKQLIEKGLELGYIRKDYKLLAARQLQTTQSPGAALYEDMKTWDHWSPNP